MRHRTIVDALQMLLLALQERKGRPATEAALIRHARRYGRSQPGLTPAVYREVLRTPLGQLLGLTPEGAAPPGEGGTPDGWDDIHSSMGDEEP